MATNKHALKKNKRSPSTRDKARKKTTQVRSHKASKAKSVRVDKKLRVEQKRNTKAPKVAHTVPIETQPSPETILNQTPQFRTRANRIFRQPLFWLISLTLGINIMIASGWYYLYKQTILSFKVTPTVSGQLHLRGEQPKAVSIQKVGISTTIIPAEIKEGIWQTSDSQATHLASSARPAEGGNIVIYAHNLKKLFAPLHQVNVGDVIQVITEDGTQYEYKISNKMVVTPDQVEAVLPTDHEVLTLYTCTGLFDSKRLVVQAFPSAVSSTRPTSL